MTYGGESNAKKLARLHIWNWFSFHRKCGAVRKLAVLSGPQACDVRVAIALGFDSHSIVAIDRDAAALREAKALLGELGSGVDWRCSDFEDVVSNESFSAVFMDSCSPILHLATAAMATLTGITGTDTWSARGSGEETLRSVLLAVGGMYGRDGKHLDKTGSGLPPDKRRMRHFNSRLAKAAAAVNSVYSSQTACSYSSRRLCADGKIRGTPMLYTAGLFGNVVQVERFKPMLDQPNGDGTVTKSGSARKHRRTCLALARRLNKKQQKLSKGQGSLARMIAMGNDLDGEKVKGCAIRIAKETGAKAASNLLCLPEGTVRAWLAHETRGTYGDDYKAAGEGSP